MDLEDDIPDVVAGPACKRQTTHSGRAAATAFAAESDEAYARKLQKEENQESHPTADDAALARKMQDEWESEHRQRGAQAEKDAGESAHKRADSKFPGVDWNEEVEAQQRLNEGLGEEI